MAALLETLPDSQQQLIRKHLELVIEANKTTNLTRIDTVGEAMILHVEDSLAGLEELNQAPEGVYGDMGSGGGFPGIPLAVTTGRHTVLIDARQKKMNIMKGIIEQLGLSDQIETYAGRAELLARSKPQSFAALSARALAKLPVLLELASPLLMHDGVLICYKANVDDTEFADALRVQELVGMKLISDRSFDLEGFDRRILVFRKTSKPRVKLPRLEGQAQKQPL